MAPRATPGDLQYGLASREEGALCNALNNVFFKRTRSLAQWEWEFLPPHLPFAEIPYAVARDAEKIIGTQGLIILPMLSRRGPFWTAKGEDTIVNPRYWGGDVLVEMYKVLFTFCERNGVPLIWGFNSRKSSFSKAGLQYFGEPSVRDLFRSLDHRAADTVLKGTSRMKKRFERPGGDFVKTAASLATMVWADARASTCRSLRMVSGKAAKNIVIEELTGLPGAEFETLSHRFVKRHGGITLYRTAAFVTWRLLDNPFGSSTIMTAKVNGELYGYMALSQTVDGHAYISDQFICAPTRDTEKEDAVVELLIDALVSRARASGASVLHANSFNAHRADGKFRAVARRMGFLSRAMRVYACYRTMPGVCELPDTVANYDDWFVTSANTEGRMG